MDNSNGPLPESYFHDASVEVAGVVYTLTADESRAFQNGLNYWHAPGDPSTWLSVAIFLEARRRIGGTDNRPSLELAARSLGISVERLQDSIEWHENYMRWHDGDPDYSVQ